MGRPDVDDELSDLSRGEKASCDIKQENSTTTVPLPADSVRWQQQLLARYLQTFWGQYTPFFINIDDTSPLDFSDLKNWSPERYTCWYLDSLLKAGLGAIPPSAQAKETTLNENHCNLALLAEVAYAHSSNENPASLSSGEEQIAMNNRKNNYHATDDSRCRRIRNNEACRKSRLRRKQLNAAAKEKLVSLRQSNDELKRKIVILEEEVKTTRNALVVKMAEASRSSMNQAMLSSQWYCGGSTLPKELEEKSMVEHVQ